MVNKKIITKKSTKKVKKKKAPRKPRLRSLKSKARYYFQRWIRARDLGKKCICKSCDNILEKMEEFDAGHYHAVALYSNMLFDERNVHGQCKGCNGFRHGNLI